MAKKETDSFICVGCDDISMGNTVEDAYQTYCDTYTNDPVSDLEFYKCTRIQVKQSINIVLTEKE